MGENLQWSTNNSPKLAVDQWMSSPGHRANILNPEFKMLAVAYYGNTCAQLFLTQ
ncbi:MAG: CAP domain-containing protein [Oscillospiraceae bacterium]|nr:CAP domain-containing protein [Oscillospiraceae bacterium]